MADSNDQACVDCAPSGDLFSQRQDNAVTKTYDPIDPTTFVPPTPGSPPSVAIEYCDRVSLYRYGVQLSLIVNGSVGGR